MIKTSPTNNHSSSIAFTERERMSEKGDQTEYESVIVSADGRMGQVKNTSRDFSQPLQSVALVSEILHGHQFAVITPFNFNYSSLQKTYFPKLFQNNQYLIELY